LRLTADEVMFIIQAIENATIKGKDSTMVSKVYEKTQKEFKRLVEKEQSK